MQFTKTYKFKSLALLLGLLLFSNVAFSNEKLNEIDAIRAELSYAKDKDSFQYSRTKQKLAKLILKNNIDYSDYARLLDIQRLIHEQKYQGAIYEIYELIDKGYEVSRCYEFLGDISYKRLYPAKKTANYFKTALQHDKNNESALFKLAKLYLKENKNIISLEYFKQLVDITQNEALLFEIEETISKINPKSKYETNNIYEILGNIYLKTNRKNDSYEAYSKALAVNPKDIYLRYHLASLLFEDNQNKYAIGLFNSILFENPKDYQIKATRAKTNAKDGNISEALKEYQEILEHYPNSAQAKYGIYKAYENKLNPIEILKKLSFKENYKPTVQDLLNFASFLADMDDTLAAQNFQHCANILQEEENQKLLAIQKEKERKEEEKLKKEEEKLKKKAQKQSNNQKIKKTTPQKEIKKSITKKIEPTSTEKTGKKSEQEILKTKEAQNKAIKKEREKAIAKNPKKYQELKATADKYLAMQPRTAQNLIAAANTYKLMGEPTSAIQYYNEAMKLDPTNSDIYYNIGLTYFEQNNTQEAKKNLIKSINLDTENTKSKNLLAFVNQKIVTQELNKAYTLYEKKKYIEAFETLDNGIKEYPTHAQLYYYRALIYIAMNRNAAAIIDLQKTIELDPSQYMAYYQLGQTYEKINDERSALVAYEKFLSTEPTEKELITEIQQKVISLGAKYY